MVVCWKRVFLLLFHNRFWLKIFSSGEFSYNLCLMDCVFFGVDSSNKYIWKLVCLLVFWKVDIYLLGSLKLHLVVYLYLVHYNVNFESWPFELFNNFFSSFIWFCLLQFFKIMSPSSLCRTMSFFCIPLSMRWIYIIYIQWWMDKNL